MRLGSHYQESVTLLKDGRRTGDADHSSSPKPGNHGTVPNFLHDLAEGMPYDRRILDLDMHAACNIRIIVLLLQLGFFLRYIYFEK